MEKEVSRREFIKVSVSLGTILAMAPNMVLAQEPKALEKENAVGMGEKGNLLIKEVRP